ncbi:hypothetical protein QR680_000030 [Steinernema hermaphroditum]|uniref:Uncharacterized protein n=1 Tax=Steinernema hermaphroditum TaxID=289476 RepID=A0AA39GTS6_9BILA|nr:hypothetical protein QR680_000030 [Steinernema hermaphroditum]
MVAAFRILTRQIDLLYWSESMPRKPDAREYVADRNLLQVAVPSNRDGCHARTPYASLMATLLCVIGVIMFAIMMTWSFNTAIEQTRRTLSIDKVPWIDRVQIGLYIIVPIMSLSSLFLLFVGFLSTGSTREELYGNAKSRKGGRSACAIAIVLSYVLTIVWISIIAFTAITVFIYYVFSSLCSSLPSYTESDCVDLGLLKRLTKGFPDANLRLCGADVQQFCAFTTTAFTTIVVAYIGASILLLGLMQFLVCNGCDLFRGRL